MHRKMLLRPSFAVCVCLAAAAQAQVPVPSTKEVPAGRFQMGSDEGHSWEKPAHEVSVPAYGFGVRPVTNAEFQAFRPSHVSPGGSEADQPVTGVSWADAAEYCAWLSQKTGRRFTLPTEARWERAVRGDLAQKSYPWGDEAPASSGDDFNATAHLNAFGISAVGYNVWEWTSDWYAADYYSQSPDFDPQGPESGDFKVLRGGGYRGDPSSATTYTRGSARPDTRSEHITFRVAEALGADDAPAVTRNQPNPPPPPAPAQAAPAPTRPVVASVGAARKQPPPAPAASPAVGAELRGVEVIFPSTGPEIRLDTTGKPATKAFGLSNPARLVVDLQGVKVAMSPMVGEISGGREGVSRVRYSQFQLDPPVARIVIDLDRLREYELESTADAVVVRLAP